MAQRLTPQNVAFLHNQKTTYNIKQPPMTSKMKSKIFKSCSIQKSPVLKNILVTGIDRNSKMKRKIFKSRSIQKSPMVLKNILVTGIGFLEDTFFWLALAAASSI